jgi:hypothetical protein
MKLRIGLTIYLLLVSLFASAIFAFHLDFAIELYSPLDATHLGPHAPAFTEQIIRDAPHYPAGIAACGALTLLAALYFWRSGRPVETKTFAITFIAALNLMVALFLPLSFLNGYFVVPKAANAALAAGSSADRPAPGALPPFVRQLIAQQESAPKKNPPGSILEYRYRGQVVYYVPPSCCDVPGELYAVDGHVICEPDGGMTGGGDGKCPDFFATRTQERLVWADKR